MDLSFLSDDEIRDVDARIHATWDAGMRVLLGNPPTHGIMGRAGTMCIDVDSYRVVYQINHRNVWYTCIDADKRDISSPRDASEAFNLWCAIVGGNVRELYQKYPRRRPWPCIVCNVVLKNDVDTIGPWLHHDVLITPSVARLERVLAPEK